MENIVGVFLFVLAAVSAVPYDPVVRKLDPNLRYQYAEGPDGSLHLSDLWVKASNVEESRRYDAESLNTYHLFSRLNPSVSQPIVYLNNQTLVQSNYDSSKKTVVLIHGWLDTITSNVVSVLVPAMLEAQDVNIIAVDWSVGSGTPLYTTAVINTPISGEAVAKFITWLNEETGGSSRNYIIVGHGLGAHQAGTVGRNLLSRVSYIMGLDPAFPGWITNSNKLSRNDGEYVEVIHTNAGHQGYLGDLGHADFYPNGGIDMPGCISQECDQNRSIFYFGESITSGGFTGTRCSTYITAMAGQCFLWGSLRMGGLTPKTGSSGIYHLRTRAFPPFSLG